MNNLLSLCAMDGIIKYQKTISLLMNFSINRFVEKPLEMKKFELSNEVYRNYDENTEIEQTIFNTIMNYHMFTENYFPDFEKAKKNNDIIEDDIFKTINNITANLSENFREIAKNLDKDNAPTIIEPEEKSICVGFNSEW